jgi:hypothetical protein
VESEKMWKKSKKIGQIKFFERMIKSASRKIKFKKFWRALYWDFSLFGKKL